MGTATGTNLFRVATLWRTSKVTSSAELGNIGVTLLDITIGIFSDFALDKRLQEFKENRKTTVTTSTLYWTILRLVRVLSSSF